jgi:hypothetical protein
VGSLWWFHLPTRTAYPALLRCTGLVGQDASCPGADFSTQQQQRGGDNSAERKIPGPNRCASRRSTAPGDSPAAWATSFRPVCVSALANRSRMADANCSFRSARRFSCSRDRPSEVLVSWQPPEPDRSCPAGHASSPPLQRSELTSDAVPRVSRKSTRSLSGEMQCYRLARRPFQGCKRQFTRRQGRAGQGRGLRRWCADPSTRVAAVTLPISCGLYQAVSRDWVWALLG